MASPLSPLRLLLPNGTLKAPRKDQLSELERVQKGQPSRSTALSNEGFYVYADRDGQICRYVVNSLNQIKYLRVDDLRLVKMNASSKAGGKVFLEPPNIYHDYNQKRDLTLALQNGQGQCFVQSQDEYGEKQMVYINAANIKVPVVAPLTDALLQNLCPQSLDTIEYDLTPPPLMYELSVPQQQWEHYAMVADVMWGIYDNARYAFPRWSIEMLKQGLLYDCARTSRVYHSATASLDEVKRVALEREPVNIEMNRYYNRQALKANFEYETGAYASSSTQKLMPNIAIYTRTPMGRGKDDEKRYFHVINVIGYAFDSEAQPDYQYFHPFTGAKWQELVDCMRQMWTFIFECARRNRLKSVCMTGVGGGHFSKLLGKDTYQELKKQSLAPVIEQYPQIRCLALPPSVENWFWGPEAASCCHDTLLVNAWDPWSMVGNGNEADNSLDGMYGRWSALAVLCWPPTNPMLKYESVP